MIENPRTGEQVEFLSETDVVLTMLATWPPRRHRAIAHIHPKMEERFEVLEGHAGFNIDGAAVHAPPGTVVVVPPGRRHLAWNATEQPVRLRIEMRPGLRWREFTTRFFAGEDPNELLREFREEVALPPD